MGFFANLFRAFASRTGPLHGVAMVCDESADLNIIGRFGVPKPDELGFCQKFTPPLVDMGCYEYRYKGTIFTVR